MIYSARGPSYLDDWSRAASQASEVIAIRIGHQREALDGIPTYAVPRLDAGPKSMFRIVTHEAMIRRLVTAVTKAEAEHGAIDILHGHFYSARNLPAISRRLGIPYVLTEHSTRLTGKSAKHKPLTQSGLKIAERVYGASARILAVSRYLAEAINRLGLPGDVEVVGDPIDIDLFHPEDGHRSNGLIRVVSVGRLEADKRPLLLLDAFESALRDEPRLHLELIGEGPDRQQVIDAVARRGLADRVETAGRLPRREVAARVRNAAVFALASEIETFGIATAEAIASGVPVVVPHVGSLPELVDLRSGVLVEPGRADAMAQGIIRAVRPSTPYNKRAMSQHISHRFSPRAIGERLRPIYEAVAASAASG
jgi:glycosyltransferase involved in cell wall biosynthesis